MYGDETDIRRLCAFLSILLHKMLKKADRKDLLQIKVFACHIKVFARLFQKAARAAGGDGRAPQSAKSPHRRFLFFVAFSFAAAMAKEKADRAGVFFGYWRTCFFIL